MRKDRVPSPLCLFQCTTLLSVVSVVSSVWFGLVVGQLLLFIFSVFYYVTNVYTGRPSSLLPLPRGCRFGNGGFDNRLAIRRGCIDRVRKTGFRRRTCRLLVAGGNVLLRTAAPGNVC